MLQILSNFHLIIIKIIYLVLTYHPHFLMEVILPSLTKGNLGIGFCFIYIFWTVSVLLLFFSTLLSLISYFGFSFF